MDLYWGLSSSWHQEDDTNVRTYARGLRGSVRMRTDLCGYIIGRVFLPPVKCREFMA